MREISGLTPVLRIQVYTSALRWSVNDIVYIACISVACAAASALYGTLTNCWNVR